MNGMDSPPMKQRPPMARPIRSTASIAMDAGPSRLRPRHQFRPFRRIVQGAQVLIGEQHGGIAKPRIQRIRQILQRHIAPPRWAAAHAAAQRVHTGALPVERARSNQGIASSYRLSHRRILPLAARLTASS